MEQLPKILEKLKSHLENLPSQDRDGFYSSTTALKSICERFYNDNSAFVKDLDYVRGQVGIMISMNSDAPGLGPGIEELKVFYERLLTTMIEELEELGVPSKDDVKIDKSINVNVSQSQILELKFINEVIKDELTGKQFKELQEIIDNEKDPKKAKPKLIKKFKEFGMDITSNIIAGFLTNPSLWTAFGG